MDGAAVMGASGRTSSNMEVFDWSYDVLENSAVSKDRTLTVTTMAVLEGMGLLDGWKAKRQKVENFLTRVEAEYRPNPYHCATHAADVTQATAVILKSVAEQLPEFPKMEAFCSIIAAAVHDLGHLGVNNDFLINTSHPWAITYNDRSVNESYHISRAFQIIDGSPEFNIFDGFTPAERKAARRLMIDAVLATDMAIHFDLLGRWSRELEAKPDIATWADPSLIYQMAVHLADIANPARPFGTAYAWAERVITEFIEQGEEEARRGMPVSAMCDRALIKMPKAQMGFIKLFVRPTLEVFSPAAPSFCQHALQLLETSLQEWDKLDQQGVVQPTGKLRGYLPPRDCGNHHHHHHHHPAGCSGSQQQ